jgi:alanine racemase
MDTHKRTWAEISLGALEHNFRALRSRIPESCKLLASVKADAYGHGAVRVAGLLEELGADFLSAATLEEALELRRAGISLPILILGWTPPEEAAVLSRCDISQTVFSVEYGEKLRRNAEMSGSCVKIHIKLDTGMSRLGYDTQSEEELSAIASLGRSRALSLEGVFTHFAEADTGKGRDFTRLQMEKFQACVQKLEDEYNTKFPIRHCANSAGVINWPQSHMDMVRVGISLYGYMPDRDMPNELGLRPAMTLKTTVAQVRELKKGATVSYGRTALIERDTREAVLTIGYADGLLRSNSNKFEVLIRNRRAKSLGRICMDMCMVDVTDIPDVRPGDIATVFGEELSAEEYAHNAGTISYEILCAVGKRVKRVYTDERLG